MREARIIAPLTDNDGRSTLAARNTLERELINIFKGFTRVAAYGAWRDETTKTDHLEEVFFYEIAVRDGDGPTLRDIARTFCKAAEQECVYLRLPDGTVHFITQGGTSNA